MLTGPRRARCAAERERETENEIGDIQTNAHATHRTFLAKAVVAKLQIAGPEIPFGRKPSKHSSAS